MQCVVISHGEGWVYASPLQPGASLLTRQRPGSGLRSLLAALKGAAGRALLRRAGISGPCLPSCSDRLQQRATIRLSGALHGYVRPLH